MTIPFLPVTRSVDLPTGRVVLRELSGPQGAPTIVLLHGLGVTADINFFRCYQALGEQFHVLAFDHRGHGDGLRTRRPFRLSDCADDVAAMADIVGVDRFVPVGYSMGGAVAQLVWKRHRRRVGGLVLCATASHFNDTRVEQINFLGLGGLAAMARLTPPAVRRTIAARYRRDRHADWATWAREQTARSDWRAVLEAGAALGRFRSDPWLTEIDVPVSVVMTLADSMVPVARQRRLSELLDDVVVFPVAGDHDAVASLPQFPATLVAAIDSVVTRAA
ncbi:MAG TPA: alpha/beta hydrolase [Desertimonas sp.]|nr:alpha/beta hydrolase [Desertimonas sp.]